MEQHSWHVRDVGVLHQVAAELLKHCEYTRKFALYGDLGVGKTALVKAACRQLGLDERDLSSPSFAIVNEYGPDPIVYHLDLYRIQSPGELLDIGLEQYLDQDEYCFMEWPEIAEPWLDESVKRLHLFMNPDGSRRIELHS